MQMELCGQDWMDGRWTDGMADGRMHTRTEESHFYSPPLPRSGDNKPAKTTTS